MARRLIGAAVAAGLAVGPLAGCAGKGLKSIDLAGLTVGPPAGGANPPTELPPKEAAAACLASAQELDKHGNVDEAVALYERARRLDPDAQAGVCRRLAVLYDRKGEFTRADAEYDKALKAAPKDADLLADLGYSHYCRGNWAKAEEHLARATALDPANQRAWVNHGLAVGMQGRADDSLASFRKAVPEPQARCNLGFVLATRGETDKARVQYREALTLAPDLKLAHVALDKLDHPTPAGDRTAAGGRPAAAPAPYPLSDAPIVIDPDAAP